MNLTRRKYLKAKAASVAANVASVGSVAVASADQDSIIAQNLEGVAEANADQTVDMDQSGS